MAQLRRRATDHQPRPWKLIVVCAVSGMVCALALTFAGYRLASRSAGNTDLVQRVCANQHAVIEMQRLFLAEHAAIRTQLLAAGVPTEHADPRLLERLELLIEEADCVPAGASR